MPTTETLLLEIADLAKQRDRFHKMKHFKKAFEAFEKAIVDAEFDGSENTGCYVASCNCPSNIDSLKEVSEVGMVGLVEELKVSLFLDYPSGRIDILNAEIERLQKEYDVARTLELGEKL